MAVSPRPGTQEVTPVSRTTDNHACDRVKTHTKVLVRNLTESCHLEELDINGKIILKRILSNDYEKLWNGHTIGITGRLV